MDVISSNTSASSSSKFHLRKKIFHEEDRITNLPDNTIHHILSFLPAKDAAATSLLSTRWRYLWIFIPNFQFHDDSSRISDDSIVQKHFKQFVERTLLIHEATINKFHLSITKRYDPYHVYSWISAALTRKVRELVLDVAVTPLMLPPCIFSSELLSVLKIETRQHIRFPPVICFSGLKVLHLGFVCISVEEELQHVFINCPVLEQLTLRECEWFCIKTVNISAPVLKRLMVEDNQWGEDDELYDCEIEFFTNSLVSFDLKSNLPYQYSLNNLSSLVTANIDVLKNIPPHTQEIRRLNTLLRGIFNVKDITLSNYTLMALSQAALLADLATFPNLTHLRVNVDNHSTQSIGLTNKQLMDLFYGLSGTAYLVFTALHLCTFENHSLASETVPSNFLSCLKCVDFKNYHGSTTELRLINFLLKNARVLENMTIFIEEGLSIDPKKQLEITKQLQMLEAREDLVKGISGRRSNLMNPAAVMGSSI